MINGFCAALVFASVLSPNAVGAGEYGVSAAQPSPSPTFSIFAGDEAFTDVQLDASGRRLAVGNFVASSQSDIVVARFIGGMLDDSYAGHGLAIYDHDGRRDVATALQPTADGGVLIAGGSDDAFMLVKLDRNGIPDGRFGTNGSILIQPLGVQVQYLRSLTLDAAGRAVAVGPGMRTGVAGLEQVTVVIRVLADGSLDPYFDLDGIKILDAAGTAGAVVALEDDGHIVVGGNSYDEWAISRLTEDGAMDASFGTGGVVTLPVAAGTALDALAVSSTGRILSIGGTPAILTVLNDDGSVARMRGRSAGDAITSSKIAVRDAIWLDDDTLMLVGSCYDGSDRNLLAGRLAIADNAITFALDICAKMGPAFSGSGERSVAMGAIFDGSGRIAIAGYRSNGYDNDFLFTEFTVSLATAPTATATQTNTATSPATPAASDASSGGGGAGAALVLLLMTTLCVRGRGRTTRELP